MIWASFTWGRGTHYSPSYRIRGFQPGRWAEGTTKTGLRLRDSLQPKRSHDELAALSSGPRANNRTELGLRCSLSHHMTGFQPPAKRAEGPQCDSPGWSGAKARVTWTNVPSTPCKGVTKQNVRYLKPHSIPCIFFIQRSPVFFAKPAEFILESLLSMVFGLIANIFPDGFHMH